MKHSRLTNLLTAGILGMLLCFGSLNCIRTAFGLNFRHSTELTFGFMVLSLVLPGIAMVHGSRFWLLSGLILASALFWYFEIPRQQLVYLLETILSRYASAYGFSLPELPLHGLVDSAELPLAFWGVWILSANAGVFARRKGTVGALVLTFVPLGLCLIVTDTIPDSLPLVQLLFAAGLLTVTAAVRRESTVQANRLLYFSLLPLGALVLGLLLLLPREGYVNHAQEVRERLIAHLRPVSDSLREDLGGYVAERLPGAETPGSPVSTVNLAALHGQPKTGRRALYVTTDASGSLYLRQQDFDQYTGVGWYANREREERFGGLENAEHSVTVEALVSLSGMLLPYYPSQTVTLSAGSASNREGSREYTLSFCEKSPYTSLSQEAWSTYLALPDFTRAGAEEILRTLPAHGESADDVADAILRYVSASASYDRQTGAMDGAARDFALWFLQESDRGYCVHFATASVVLLRASGIPARYVTGYLAIPVSGERTPVLEDSAHAWAEYFDGNAGCWKILDATPPETPAELPTRETGAPTQPAETEAPPPDLPAESLPTGTVPAEPDAPLPAEKMNWLPILLPLGIGLAAGLILILQRRIRLEIRRKRFSSAEPNRQALLLWRELELLSARTSVPLPEEARAIAEKAAYSAQGVTSREILALKSCRKQQLSLLRSSPALRRFLDRYLYVYE